MGILDENLIIRPNTTWDLFGKITDEQSGKKRRLTRNDIRQSAINLANTTSGDLATAQDYLDGYVTLTGNKSRKKLFDKAFQQERSRIKQEALQKELLDQVKIDSSNLSEDEKRAFANAFRDRNVGTALSGTPNYGDNSLGKIAGIGIGVPLLASTLGPNLIEPWLAEAGVPVLRTATPYIDNGVSAVTKWLAKPRPWYNPIHMGKVLFNPKTAYTAAGEAIGSALDIGGAYFSAKDLKNNVWTPLKQQYQDQGYIDAKTLPTYISQAGMDVMGTLPMLTYADDFAKIPGYVYSGLGRLADDTVQSFRALRSGVEPVLGFRADPYNQSMDFRSFDSSDYTSRFLPELPDEIHLTEPAVSPGTQAARAPRPLQYSRLSPDVVSQLNNIGLRRYDIQNLLDRGFSPEQMLRLASQTGTPGYTSNRRANILAQRLSDLGESPVLPTRLDYLRSAVNNGSPLLEYNHVPYTWDEWNELPETNGLDPFEHEWTGGLDWVDRVFYNSAPTPNVPTPVPSVTQARQVFTSPQYIDLYNKLAYNLKVFGDDEFAAVQPRIKQILENGINNGKSAAEIESELTQLYESVNKPFNLGSGEIRRGRASAKIEGPGYIDATRAIFDGIHPSFGKSAIRLNSYPTADEVPYLIVPGQEVYSPTSFSIFDAPATDVQSMQSNVMNNLLHGGVSYDVHKSMQSTPMADRMYSRLIDDGKAVGTFLPSGHEWDNHYGDAWSRVSQYMPNDGYYYRKTNDFGGGRWNPRAGVGKPYEVGINNPTLEEILTQNISEFETFLNKVNPKVFSDMGGYPKYGIEIDGKFYDLPISQVDGRLTISRGTDLNDAVRAFDEGNEQILNVGQIMDDFKIRAQDLVSKYIPNGVLKQNNKGIWGFEADSKFIPFNSYFNSGTAPQAFQSELQSIMNNTNNALRGGGLSPDARNILINSDRVFLHQPVRAVRSRKFGGIINKLNPLSRRLLNI